MTQKNMGCGASAPVVTEAVFSEDDLDQQHAAVFVCASEVCMRSECAVSEKCAHTTREDDCECACIRVRIDR